MTAIADAKIGRWMKNPTMVMALRTSGGAIAGWIRCVRDESARRADRARKRRLKLSRVDPVRVHDSARDGIVEQFGEGRVTETSGHWHVLYVVWPPGLDDHSTGCYL